MMTTSLQTCGELVMAKPVALGPSAGRRSTRPLRAEAADDLAGLWLERHQILSAHRQQSRLGTGAPVGDAARRLSAQLIALEALLHPDGLSGFRIERLDQADPVLRVEDAVDHQRRRAERVAEAQVGLFGAQLVGDRRAAPRDSEVGDVRGVDLIERRVLGEPLVARVVAPFAAPAGAGL